MALVLLEAVLELPVMCHARVRTACSGRRRPVSWASVIEMPVEDFVRPDELVLTTGMGCGESGDGFAVFLGQVIDSGAAAIGVSTGRYLSVLPQDALDLADRAGFPVIEIPWAVRFADITRGVSEALMVEEHRDLVRLQALQANMLERVVAGASADEVAGVLAEELSRPVRLADPEGRVLGVSHRGSTAAVPVAPGDAALGAACGSAGVDDGLRVPVRSADRTEGYMVVGQLVDPGRVALGVLPSALERASAACAVWFRHRNALHEAETRRHEDFVWSLARGQLSEEEATAQGSVMGYRLDRPRVCLLARLESAGETHDASGPDDVEVRRRVGLVVQQAARNRGHSIMEASQHPSLLLYVESPGEKLAGPERLLDEVDRMLCSVGLGGRVSWGLAPAGHDVEGFSRGYSAAREALEVGRRQWGPGHRTSSEELVMHRVLARMVADPSVAALVTETLGPLIDYDQRKQGQLLRTLGEFIRARGQASRAAQALLLHRQSLLYRLSKIELLTGRSLADPDDWFQLSLAHRLLMLELGSVQAGEVGARRAASALPTSPRVM